MSVWPLIHEISSALCHIAPSQVEEVLETSTEESTQVQRLFFEDLQVGDNWLSEEREITAEDVADFALLTGDHDPLHQDGGISSPFGEPVAHGLLVALPV